MQHTNNDQNIKTLLLIQCLTIECAFAALGALSGYLGSTILGLFTEIPKAEFKLYTMTGSIGFAATNFLINFFLVFHHYYRNLKCGQLHQLDTKQVQLLTPENSAEAEAKTTSNLTIMPSLSGHATILYCMTSIVLGSFASYGVGYLFNDSLSLPKTLGIFATGAGTIITAITLVVLIRACAKYLDRSDNAPEQPSTEFVQLPAHSSP